MKRRSGAIGGDPAVFDEYEGILFEIFGVDRERLCDLWADQPFLGVSAALVVGDVVPGGAGDGEVFGQNMDLGEEVAIGEPVEIVTVGNMPELDSLSRDIQLAKLEKLRKQNLLLDIQLELATLELAAKRGSLPREF